MKKVVSVFLFLLMLCSSCSHSGTGEEDAPVDMNEVMKISAWLLDKDLEGKGCCGFITEAEKTYPRKEDGSLFWIPNDGEAAVANEDLFVFEPPKSARLRDIQKVPENMGLLCDAAENHERHLAMEANDCLKSRMRENRTYGSEEGRRQ